MLIRRLMKNYVTDGVIDLVPVYSGSHSEDLHFGSVLDWKITLHNRPGEIGRISLRHRSAVQGTQIRCALLSSPEKAVPASGTQKSCHHGGSGQSGEQADL